MVEKMSPEILSYGSSSCAIYRQCSQWRDMRTASVGQFNSADLQEGVALLNMVIETLRAEGFAALIGPMDGDIWHTHRIVEKSDGSPPFLMEPKDNPSNWQAFCDVGFTPIARYLSNRATLDVAIGNEEPVKLPDVTIRAWDGQNAEVMLLQFFAVASAQFSRAKFFRAISEDEFLALYTPILPQVDPRFLLFALDPNEELLGFLFGIPDLLAGPQTKTVILKTYASAKHGVGYLLADSFHRRAREAGYTEVIHALMHEENVSRQRSLQHSTHIFRRYALMGRKLALY